MGWLKDLGNAMLGGLPNIIGSALGAVSGISQQNSANRANMELAQYQFDRNLEMWNKQNEYNTPANQMARYMEAGLNPNLIYSQGTPGIATNAPEYKAPEIRKFTNFGDFGMSSAMQAGLTMQQTQSNIELQKSQADLNFAKEQTEIQKASLTGYQALSELIKYHGSVEDYPILRKLQKQSLVDLEAASEKKYAEIFHLGELDATEMAKREEIQTNIDNIRKNIEISDERIREIQANVNLSYKQASYLVSQTLGQDFNNTINDEQRSYIKKRIEEQALILEQERIKLNKDNTWYEKKLQFEAARIISGMFGVSVRL